MQQSLSHDLRTPLTAIRGAAETLASAGDALDAAARADLLASTTQDTGRMTKFLSNIMEMAWVETGEINARRDRLRIPMKSAMHSNSKPATDSDFKPAGYSDLMSAT